jgi:hypothetical protein
MGKAFAGTSTGNKIQVNRENLDKYGGNDETKVKAKLMGVGSLATQK